MNKHNKPVNNSEPSNSNKSKKILIIVLIAAFLGAVGYYFAGGNELFEGKMVLKKSSGTAAKIANEEKQNCEKNGGIWNDKGKKCLETMGQSSPEPAPEPTPAPARPQNAFDKYGSMTINFYTIEGRRLIDAGYGEFELGRFEVFADSAPDSNNPAKLKRLSFKISGNQQPVQELLTNIRIVNNSYETLSNGVIAADGIIEFDFADHSIYREFDNEPYAPNYNRHDPPRRNGPFRILADITNKSPSDTFSFSFYANDSDGTIDLSFLSPDQTMDNNEDYVAINEGKYQADGQIALPSNFIFSVADNSRRETVGDTFLIRLTNLEIREFRGL